MEGLTLGEATELLLERIQKIEDTEELSLWEAPNRVLAEPVTAHRSQPPFPRSPLDGYAVFSEDIRGANRSHPAVLRVIDEVTAGHVSREKVVPGAAVRIMTGAPIPEGADCVVMQEDTDYGEHTVEIYKEIKAYQNYCFEGEDYKAGTELLKEGTQLGFAEIGVLASLGYETVKVYRKPKAALLTTGDEIVLPGQEPGPGQIYDSNLYTLGSRLLSWGVDLTFKERAGDDVGLVAERIRKAAKNADLIITTGGVSVGKKDIMHEVLKLLDCERLFWRLQIKPGMPTLCAQYKGKLLICLSGNPFGAAANLELLVKPLLAKLTGRKNLETIRKQAVTESAFPKKSGVTRYVRAYFEDGRVRIPSGLNDSGILSSMCGCNCLMEIPAGTECVREGDTLWIVML